MKQVFSAVFIVFALLAGCTKGTGVATPLTKLNIVNASVNLGPVTARFTGMGQPNYWSQLTKTTDYCTNNFFTVLADVPISLAIASTDTLHPVYSGNLILQNGNLNTLFLAGQAGAVDSILYQKNIPYYYDSSCGIQFINLSYNCAPITVTQAITPNVADVAALAYKQYTDFKTYSTRSADSAYNFQVRDAGTNVVLGTYYLKSPNARNVTLAWVGRQGGAGDDSLKMIRINNYQ